LRYIGAFGAGAGASGAQSRYESCAPHIVVDPNKAFRSKTLAKDAKFSFTFTTAGDFDYVCSIHPNMKGKVIVKPGAS
jgi:plastocyanin